MSETDTMRPHAGGIDFPAASSTGDEVIAAERLHGAFTRQLFLGETLDAERLLASYETRVLTLRIPVAEPATP